MCFAWRGFVLQAAEMTRPAREALAGMRQSAPPIGERSANKGGLVRWSWNGFRGDDSIRGVR